MGLGYPKAVLQWVNDGFVVTSWVGIVLKLEGSWGVGGGVTVIELQKIMHTVHSWIGLKLCILIRCRRKKTFP